MAHKKGVGSSRNGRDSCPKMLGVKKAGGSWVIPGNIIVRQRGTQFRPSANVGMGRDHTIFAKIEGRVKFFERLNHKWIMVEPGEKPYFMDVEEGEELAVE